MYIVGKFPLFLRKENLMSTHVVTGGTGFIGSAIILELLRQTDVEIISIVRSGTRTAEDRLYNALEKAGRAYDYDERFLQAAKKRCHVIVGDVTAPFCGVTGTLPMQVDQFWHCAASLQYEDRYKAEIYATNLDGANNALNLAQRLNVRDCFNYISTAYVAGWRTGVIPEQIMAENWTNNHYEASKVEAETSVAHTRELRTRILRPSVVIGHSQTFAAANSFSGMYGFMRKLLQFKGAMSRVQEGLLSRETIQMRVDPEALLNLIPIDTVASLAVQIAFSASQETFFHLTNPIPPTTSEFLRLLFQELNIKQPLLVESCENFSWIDKKLDRGIAFYSSYLIGSKTFDLEHTNAAVKEKQVEHCHLDAPTLLAYFRWYQDMLAITRPRLLATR
jgi:nucleoside-diphosphate-sugar epimerase